MNESRYSRDGNTEEDKDFFDKYSTTGESEWSRGAVTPFEDDIVLSERHYHGKGYEGVGPVNYRRADERIMDDCSDALYQCAEVDASDIELTVTDGVVSLNGTVENRLEKKIAEMTVERLPGVVDVQNLLTIESPRRKGLVMDHTPVP